MNKKLIVLILSTALATFMAASTATADVIIDGKWYPMVVVAQDFSGRSATVPPTSPQPNAGGTVDTIDEINIDGNSSRIRFKGKEDLGGGLKVEWQCETATAVAAANDQVCDRNTFLGLASKSWGKLRAGRLTTAYRQEGPPLGVLGVGAGNPIVSSSTIITHPGLGDAGDASFHKRENFSLQYHTPKIGSFSAKVHWSTAQDQNPALGRTLNSFAFVYEKGAHYGSIGYEIHNDWFGASATTDFPGSVDDNTESEDTSIRLSYGGKYGNTKVGFSYVMTEYEESGGSAGEIATLEYSAWRLNFEQKITQAVYIAGFYSWAGDHECSRIGGTACNSAGLDATHAAIGGQYRFNKTTNVFVLFGILDNDENQSYDMFGEETPGEDSSALAVGLFHKFSSK